MACYREHKSDLESFMPDGAKDRTRVLILVSREGHTGRRYNYAHCMFQSWIVAY